MAEALGLAASVVGVLVTTQRPGHHGHLQIQRRCQKREKRHRGYRERIEQLE
jgi:hypothetical protein